jgi:hypothetical protein
MARGVTTCRTWVRLLLPSSSVCYRTRADSRQVARFGNHGCHVGRDVTKQKVRQGALKLAGKPTQVRQRICPRKPPARLGLATHPTALSCFSRQSTRVYNMPLFNALSGLLTFDTSAQEMITSRFAPDSASINTNQRRRWTPPRRAAPRSASRPAYRPASVSPARQASVSPQRMVSPGRAPPPSIGTPTPANVNSTVDFAGRT